MGCAVSAGGVSPPQQTTTACATSTPEIIQVTPASAINRAPANDITNNCTNSIAGGGVEQQQHEISGENCGRLSLSPVKSHMAPAGLVGRSTSFTASHASCGAAAASNGPPRSESWARPAATATVSNSYLSPGLIETKPFRVLVIRNPVASSLLVTARERGQQSLPMEKGREEKGEIRELGAMMISQNNDQQQEGKRAKESALCDPVGLAVKENELFASDFAFSSSLMNNNSNAYSYSDRGVDKCLEMLAQEIVRRNNNARVYASSSSAIGGGAKNKIGNPPGLSLTSSSLPPLISPRGAANNAGRDVAAASRLPSLLGKNSNSNDSKPKASGGGVDTKGPLPPAVRNYYEQQQARREAASSSSLIPNLANNNNNNNNGNNDSNDSKFDNSLNDNDNSENNVKVPTSTEKAAVVGAAPAPLYTIVEMCVTERNLVEEPLPKFTHEVMRALYRGASKTAHQREVTVLSDELISEVKSANLIIIGLPRYHNGAPSTFKNYIDLITRPKETFVYDESAQAVGLLGEKDITVWTVMTNEGIEEEERAVLLRVGSTLGVDVGQRIGVAGMHNSASANSPTNNNAIAMPLSDAGGGRPEDDNTANRGVGAPNETCGGTIQLDVGGGTIAAVTTCSTVNSPDVGSASVSPPQHDHHARDDSIRTIPALMKANTSDLKTSTGNNNNNHTVVDSAKPPPFLLIPTNEVEVLSSSTGNLSLSPNLSSGNAAGATVLSASIAKVSEEEYHQNLKTCLGFIGLKKVVFLPFDVTANSNPQGLSPNHNNNGTSSSYLLSTAVATGTNVVISSSSVVVGPSPPSSDAAIASSAPPPLTSAQCPLSNLCRGENDPPPPAAAAAAAAAASSSAKPAAAVPSLLLPSPRRTLSLAPTSLASATPRGGGNVARGNSTLQQQGAAVHANGISVNPSPDSALGKALTAHSKNVAKAIVILSKLGAQ